MLKHFGRVLLMLLLAGTALAHEVPARVVVQSWVQAGENVVTVLVRVPMEAIRDVDIPLRGPGYLDLAGIDDSLRFAAETWIANEIDLYAGDSRLSSPEIAAVRVSLPSDRSFREFETALGHVRSAPLRAATELYRDQALLDVELRYAAAGAVDDLAIYPRLRRLGFETTTVIRFVTAAGDVRVFEFSDDPGVVRLDPSWYHAFLRFVDAGFEHILDGIDHLLFVLCLIVPFRRIRPLVVIVTAFTVGHSLTLAGAALGMTPVVPWFPPLIESLIALSIVYMAVENVIGARWQRRWLIAFGFGLVHGFGFSFALQETLQFAGEHVLASLLAFNIGVELGQLLVVLLAVPFFNLAIRFGLAERLLVILVSVFVAHSAWHWLEERFAAFLAWSPQFSFGPAVFGWLLLLVAGAVLLKFAGPLFARFLSREKPAG